MSKKELNEAQDVAQAVEWVLQDLQESNTEEWTTEQRQALQSIVGNLNSICGLLTNFGRINLGGGSLQPCCDDPGWTPEITDMDERELTVYIWCENCDQEFNTTYRLMGVE